MSTPKQPTFVVGERVRVKSCHKHYTPTIVAIEGDIAVVRTIEIPGYVDDAKIRFRLKDLEKIK